MTTRRIDALADEACESIRRLVEVAKQIAEEHAHAIDGLKAELLEVSRDRDAWRARAQLADESVAAWRSGRDPAPWDRGNSNGGGR